MRGQHRPAFSRSDLLACLGLFGCLVALIVPAVTAARAAADDKRSVNNLKMIVLSIHNYADSKQGSLPPGFDDNYFSASARLLPYLEQDALYKKLDFTKSIDDKANEKVRKTVLDVFVNPEDKGQPSGGKDPTKRYGATNYLYNGLVFFHNSKARFPASIPDGTSNTIAVAETLRGDGSKKAADVKRQYVALPADEAAKYKGKREEMGVKEFKAGKHIAGDRCASWMDGRLLQGTFLPGRAPNDPRPDVLAGPSERMDGLTGPRSLSDTVNVALFDGSVKAIHAKKISYTTWYHALTPAGGEVLGADW
jgi:uncharacterized protein DUF1559